MADTFDVEMPDGTVIVGVPVNTPKQEILKRWRARKYPDEKALNQQALAQETEHPSLVSLVGGLKNAGEGILQGLAALSSQRGADFSKIEEASRQRVKEENEKLRPLTDRYTGAEVAKFGGEIVPGFAFQSSRGGALARFATDAAAGTAQGFVAPLEPGQSRTGSTIGGALGASLPSGGINAARGLRNSNGRAQEMYELSRKYDVKLTPGELSGFLGLQRTEALAERVPFVGISGFRQKQSVQVQAAASKLRDQFGTGLDVGKELQEGLDRVYQKNKTEVSKLYDRVDELSKSVDDPVTSTNRKTLAAELLKAEADLGPNADQSLIKYLETHISDKPLSFDSARKLRSRLWEEARKAEKQAISGSASDAEVRLRTSIAQAVERDIEEWAERAGQQNKEILSAYRQASREFADKVAPFKDRDIRRALDTDDTDVIIGTFLKRDRPKLATKLLSKTDEKAQTAAKFYILDNAFKAAESLPDVEFSPLTFARELERLRTTNDVVFTPAEQMELKGFVKLMHAAQRAGKFRENLPTGGNRAVDVGVLAGAAALGGYAAGNVGGAAAVVGGAKAFSLLLTTDVGRSILTDVSRASERSPAMNRLLGEARLEVERIVSRSGSGVGSNAGR